MRRSALPVIAALIVAGSCIQPLPAGPPVVVLRADRCAGETSIESRRAVVMLLDVRDLSPTAKFDVELVDHQGHRVDFAPALNVSAATIAYSCRGLTAGTYYMRLTENGALRREFKIGVGTAEDC